MAMPSCWIRATKFFHLLQCARPSTSYLFLNKTDGQLWYPKSCISRKFYGKDVNTEQPSGVDDVRPNPKKKKVFIPRITLLSENDEISVMTLEMATKLAKRRNLKLVKILDLDTKSERATYKLMSTKDYLQEETVRKKEKQLDRKSALKLEKLIGVGTKISEHDLQTKLNNVVKFWKKKHKVRFVISFDSNPERAAEIVQQVREMHKDSPVSISEVKSRNKITLELVPKIEEMLKDATETDEKEPKD